MEVLSDEFDLKVRGHRLHGQRFGPRSAPVVMGLHGMSLNMKAFDFIGERLGEELQLVVFDLRGRGRSPATPGGSYGWESHALDMFAVADAFGSERFAIIGQSMGGSIAMKAAELEPGRLEAVVLLDIAGRVDPGAGAVIGSVTATIEDDFESMEAYLDAVKAQGLIDDWNEYWERCYRYGTEVVDGRVRARVNREALAEDRRYGSTVGSGLYVYERWKYLTMPTLLVRATRELKPGVGHVVPKDDLNSFMRDVSRAASAEIDANHLTVNVHPGTVDAIQVFLASL